MNWWTGFYRLVEVLFGRGILNYSDRAYVEGKISPEEYQNIINSEKGDN